MAGIGHEIDSHLFRRLAGRAVGQLHQLLAGRDALNAHVPALIAHADAGQPQRPAFMRGLFIGQSFRRAGMPHHGAHIFAHHIFPEEP